MSPSRARLCLATGGVVLVALGVALWALVARPMMAAKIIRQAAAAESTVPFQATARTQSVYGQGFLESEALICRGTHGRGRITYRGGAMDGVQMGSDGTRAWRYDPRTQALFTGPPDILAQSPLGQSHLDLMLRNHLFRLEGRETVAGRPVYRILMTPRDQQGRSIRYWVDRDTRVVLRREELDPRGRKMAETRFERIDYRPPTNSELQPPQCKPTTRKQDDTEQLGRKMKPEELGKLVGFPVLMPTYLPKGYVLDGSYLFHCPNCHDTAAETRYTNGMDSFSVFQGSTSLTQHGVGSAHGLAKVGNRQVLVWAHKDSHYALLGDLPLDTLKRVAASLPGGEKATSRGE